MDDGRIPEALTGFLDLNPELGDFRTEVLNGLSKPQKSVPCKYFYDQTGSEIFDRICRLDDYYPTRTEIGILENRIGEIAELIGRNAHLIEFGSGASIKIRTLLDALPDLAQYTAVDISRDFLLQSAETLAMDYPSLEVAAICADYTRDFSVPQPATGGNPRRVGFFPGSTIGNFTADEAAAFLKRIGTMLRTDGGLLIGVDLKKDIKTLYAAYNDSEGLTADFNFNLLRRANDELGANFDLAAFRHEAPYVEDKGRIEMRLYSEKDQKVTIADREFSFAAGEHIHTEDSHKYTIDEFRALCAPAGFTAVASWTDPDNLFCVHYFTVG